uniref:Variant surface glycoprotein 1125.369 n=1 Tax=Trypanosoma brucei TaxID=5691 RepID=A0A1J0R5S4_9TRYP|nr:variant surface glycoprotein 1125.369 [Trypanosoma brucei]
MAKYNTIQAAIGTSVLLIVIWPLMADDSKPATHMERPCQSAYVLSAMVDQIKAKMTAGDGVTADLKKKIAQAAAGLAAPRDEQITKMSGPILIVLTKQLEQIQTKQHLLRGPTVNIIAKLANLSGHQSAVETLSDIKVKGLDLGNGDPNSANNGKTNINFKSTSADEIKKCHKQLDAQEKHFANWVQTAKLYSLKLFTAAVTAEDNSNVRKPAVGKTSGAAPCSKNDVTGTVTTSAAAACIIDGPVTTAKPLHLTKGTGDFGLAGKAVTDTTDFKQFAQKTAIDLLEVTADWGKTTMTFDTGKITSYSSDDDFRAAVGATWAGLSREAALGDKSEAAPQLISTKYGDDSTFSNRYWDKLTQIKLPTTLLGEKQPQTIKEVKTMDEASKMLLQALLEVTTKNQASPSCPTKTEKAEEPKKTPHECKKHKTAEDCKKETGCDFDEKKDPKCFPKAETDKKDEKSFSSNMRVSVLQVFAALVLAAL